VNGPRILEVLSSWDFQIRDQTSIAQGEPGLRKVGPTAGLTGSDA